jgi:L-asparaginase
MQGYATGQSLASLGVITGADMTLEATVAKLHYLLSQSLSLSQLPQAMSANLRGELTLDGENSDWEAVGQLRQLGGTGG